MRTYSVKVCPHCGCPFYLSSGRKGEWSNHLKNCKSKTPPKSPKGTFQRNARRKSNAS